MKLLLTLPIMATLFLQANEDSYLLPITRDGTTHTMLAYNFWSGEYPSPVIDVQADRNKTRKIMGYTTLRNPDKKKACTIKSGIYHPWSQDKTSLINYYTIVPNVSYLAHGDNVLENLKLKKGDQLKEEIYLAEGYCSYLLNGKIALETMCIGEENSHFKRVEVRSHATEQWLYLTCQEGYKLFVEDKGLLTQKGVIEGKIIGYGEVGKK